MPHFSTLSFSKGKGLCLQDCPQNVRDFLETLPSSWTCEGEMLKNGSRSTVKSTAIEGASYVVKIYKKMPFHRRLRYALTRSRAFQSWESGQAMAEAGIPIARPLAILEERQFGIPARAALLMPVAQGDDLLSLVERNLLSPSQLTEIAEKLTEIFKTMMKSSLTHGDMKATNILIDDSSQPTLIDIDGAVIHRSRKSFDVLRAKDRARFMKNWQTHPAAREAFHDVFGKSQ